MNRNFLVTMIADGVLFALMVYGIVLLLRIARLYDRVAETRKKMDETVIERFRQQDRWNLNLARCVASDRERISSLEQVVVGSVTDPVPPAPKAPEVLM